MLASIRAFAKSWVALVLLGLLIVSFAIFGMTDVFAPRGGGNWVVKAGDRQVSGPEFRSLFDSYREQLGQQAGRPVTVEQAVEAGVHTRLLDELASGQAFAAVLEKVGIRPADQLVTEQIREFQGFFSPVTGAFDQDTYRQQLAQNNLTPERFEAELRDNVAQQHFVSGVVAGLRAPRVYAAAAAAFESEIRDVSVALIHPGLVERPAPPTDAQLTAFLRENASALRRPELRALTVVRFGGPAAAQAVAINPAEVQRQFEFRRESLSTPERRTFVQIPAPDQAAAARVVQQLRAGADAATAARSIGRDPVPFNNVARTAVTDAPIAAAAFSLPAGQVSEPVQGRLGWAVVQVQTVIPAVAASFEAARPQIEAELRAAAAEQQVTALVERYEEAHGAGANLVEAARQAGAPVLSIAPVSADGRSADGQPAALEPALLAAAFETAQGSESEVLELSPGQYAAVRVDRVIAPALPAVNEVRPQLTQAWLIRELRTRVTARAEALAQAVRSGGGNVEAVARANNAPFTRLPGVTRAGDQTAGTPPEILSRAFEAKRGEVFQTQFINTQNGPLGIAVGRVEAVRFPAAGVLAAAVNARREGISSELLQDVGEGVRRGARAAVKSQTSAERALQALGIAPDAAAAGGAPGAGGTPAQGGTPAP
jgi:peptidyl-prolyl cis-trans isomerase D